MTERQQGDVTVYADYLTRLEDRIVTASHQCPVTQNSSFRNSGRASCEEYGRRLIRGAEVHGSLVHGYGGSRKHLHARYGIAL